MKLNLRAAPVLLISLLILSGINLPARGECRVDDFNDQAAKDWIHCGEWNDSQEPEWSPRSGQFCLGLTDPVTEPPPPPLSVAAEWAPAGQDPRYANGCLRATFRTGAAQAGTWNSHFVVSMRADCRHGGYKAMLGPSLGRISIFRRYGLLADEVNHPFIEDTDYRLEFCALDTQLSLKYWALNEPEPNQPQLSANDKVYRKGNIGVGVFFDNDNPGPLLNGCYDDIRFVPRNHCAGDIDCDNQVDFDDMRAVLSAFGRYSPCQPRRVEDFNNDCVVGISDVLKVVKAWGACETKTDS